MGWTIPYLGVNVMEHVQIVHCMLLIRIQIQQMSQYSNIDVLQLYGPLNVLVLRFCTNLIQILFTFNMLVHINVIKFYVKF